MGLNKVVDFSTAKLLKEKGFDTPCKEGWVNYLTPFTGETGMPDDESNLVIDTLGNRHLIERPTIAEVVMWLYEKYGIWINPAPRLSSWIFTIQEIKTSSNNSLVDIDFYGTNDYLKSKGVPTIMLSPTEAYEAAINYTLNNLI